MFTSKSPVFSSNKLWAWSFPHHRAYRHCHFSSFSIEHFWNSECGIDLEGSILFFMAEWGVTIHEPCHVFNSTEIQLSVSISAPLTHLASNFSCTFPLYSLPLRIEYWIKGALAFHEKSLSIFISPPLASHPSGLYLLSSLLSLFTPSIESNACLLLNHQFSRWTSYGHGSSHTVIPINIVTSIVFPLYSFETVSVASLWKVRSYHAWAMPRV
jgi:hypothetical protein